MSILAANIGTSEQACDEYSTNNCDVKVICKVHAGRIEYLPSVCPSISEDRFEFVIEESTQLSLETHFFASTNFDARVKTFTAIRNSWYQIGKNAFKYYANCIEMNLSNNGINVIEEGAFAQLGKLTHLNLSHNLIEDLVTDFLLVSYEYYSEVQVVDLSYNSLKELRSNVFNEAPKLTTVYLNNNHLTFLSPNVFSDIRNLKHLYLGNNMLASLSFVSEAVKNVLTLDVSYNMLSEVHSNDTYMFLSLQNVNMSHNNINFIESNSFSRVFDLEIIDLSNNLIESDIEPLLFFNNIKLRHLDLFNNGIKSIQDNSFIHNHLEYLNLERNFVTGDINENTFAGVRLITSLNLPNQNITNIRTRTFEDMTNLVHLNLSGNQIITIEADSFINADSVQYLDLSHNEIKDLIFLNEALNNLTELDLCHNHLTIIRSEAFVNQTSLMKLDISHNSIFLIEPNALPLNKLEYLFIYGNRLNGTIQKDTFSPAKFLRRLDLSNFSINKVENQSFTDMPVLASLDLSMNQIDYLGGNNFDGMNNMYSLNVSYNKLSKLLLNESNVFSINGLYLQHNEIASITFDNMTQVNFLDLSQNNISDISGVHFDHLPNLKVLLLSNNKIQYFNTNETNALKKLTTLDLSNNSIDQINLTHFNEIEEANLSFNRLKHMAKDLFDNLSKVQLLDLSYNSISEIMPGTFKDAESLRTLNLSGNALVNLRFGVFHGLSQIHTFDLSRNLINNIEVGIFHECPKLHVLYLDYNNLSNIDVARLANIAPNLHKLSIGGNMLPCKAIVNYIKNIDQTLIRQMEITSIDKIHHDDNVNGIKCGSGVVNTTDVLVKPTEATAENSSSFGIVITWCFLLTVLFVVAGLFAYFYLYKRSQSVYEPNNEIFLNVSDSDQQSDLLS